MAYIFIRLSDKAKSEFLTAIEIMNYNNGTRLNQQDIGSSLITKWAKKYLRSQDNLNNLKPMSQKIINNAK